MESRRLVELVDARLADLLASRDTIVRRIAPELGPFARYSRDLLSGGKRFRAQFCYWGWRAVGTPATEAAPPRDAELADLVDLAAGLELFHAAALVHDDIIDHSDTRRGMPAVHRRFEALHGEEGWRGDAGGFGEGSAILLGDLLLAWSDEILSHAILGAPSLDTHLAARAAIDTMRTEVTLGQYLDLLEERAWATVDPAESLARAERVIVYKSAKYSVEAPLVIGASLRGATDDQLASLRRFGLPLGIAFQLRDDVLGVFGDAARTGKPSGDDLREGKRTVLVSLTRSRLDPSSRRLFDELLGDPELDEGQIRMLQETLRQTGALDEVERMIADRMREALGELADAPLGDTAKAELASLARRITQREA
ncbi:polyprenyl synthetase family protein [Herbiconiux moechotypicola]|uniref:Polyprenyl synthetase family protein n=2 Tax=Herbiconiux moechotypicola TaxID=637393 RepID=A0ABP5QN11_9MICO|nr:polyprenyl synthetase family protein [Herbiconiux moechotypicola]MCS5730468.1 polyprenyl synthetase family protein [Herbiconiux moechotypicola]